MRRRTSGTGSTRGRDDKELVWVVLNVGITDTRREETKQVQRYVYSWESSFFRGKWRDRCPHDKIETIRDSGM